ncbi:MAG: NADH-quinone oxidoreductase subunit D [Planctomycetota bacterium]|jgi:NADH-quinone oxidoreductase subunit D|nr:NADH-quinone oxidoreductase subunit D [Planctomycetota bacterium]
MEREQHIEVRPPSAGGNTEEYWLNMGPQHPATHGVLHLIVRLDGETVREVKPELGYIHRSVEKMAENLTLLQNIHLTDRLDYLSCHMNNHAVCMVAEQACDIGVPERAEYIRVIVSELQRIQSHLLWWGAFAMDIGALSAFLYGFAEREKITDIFERLCGARLTMNYFRPGGVAQDLYDGFEQDARQACSDILYALDEYQRLVTGNLIFQERTRGVGILSRDKAIGYGCSGGTARASGLDYDVRRDDPYGIYDRFSFDVPVATAGDCYARYEVRMEEMRQSVQIIEQALKDLPVGPIQAKAKPVLKIPKGLQVFRQVETARGSFAMTAIGDGTATPLRVSYRSPGFMHVAALHEMSAGFKIADLITILGSLDPVIPDIDR